MLIGFQPSSMAKKEDPLNKGVFLFYGIIDRMNIYDAILRSKPLRAYKFATVGSTYPSIIGNENAIVSPGSPAGANNSMSGGGGKPYFIQGNTLVTQFPERFTKDTTGLPFSLEVFLGFDTKGSQFEILSHTTKYDGLAYDGTYISFSVNLNGGGSVKAKWAPPARTKNYHVVGVYDLSTVSIFIDGELKDQADFPSGSELEIPVNSQLYTWTGNGVNRIEAVACYGHALSESEIASHYLSARQQLPVETIMGCYGGALYKFSDEGRDIQFTHTMDWKEGTSILDTVSVNDSGSLTPVYGDAGTSLAGSYTYAVPISTIGTTLGGGMKIEWDGIGNFTVQSSINDGVSWTTATNGTILTGTVGLTPVTNPLVKITFSSGRAQDLDEVYSMRLTAYGANSVPCLNGAERDMAFTGSLVTSTNWSEPVENDYNSGCVMTNANYSVLSESIEAAPTTVGSIGIWFSLTSVGTPGSTILDSRSVTPSQTSYVTVDSTGKLVFSGMSAVYLDGQAITSGTVTILTYRFYHLLAVYSTPHNAKVSFNAAGAGISKYVNMVSVHQQQLTATQALALHNAYLMSPFSTALDTNAIVVAEDPSPVKIYTSDWTPQGA